MRTKEDIQNKVDLGNHKAGEIIQYSLTEVFPTDIKEVSGNCSCQVQDWAFKDDVVRDGVVTGKVYTINGQISTPVKYKKRNEKEQILSKLLTITLVDNSKVLYLLNYTLEPNESTNNETPSRSIRVEQKRHIRVVTRPTT